MIWFYYIFQTFSSYLSFKRDNNELLLFVLKQLVRDQVSYYKNRNRGADPEIIEIDEEDFTERVCISFMTSFFLFENNIFKWEYFTFSEKVHPICERSNKKKKHDQSHSILIFFFLLLWKNFYTSKFTAWWISSPLQI